MEGALLAVPLGALTRPTNRRASVPLCDRTSWRRTSRLARSDLELQLADLDQRIVAHSRGRKHVVRTLEGAQRSIAIMHDIAIETRDPQRSVGHARQRVAAGGKASRQR